MRATEVSSCLLAVAILVTQLPAAAQHETVAEALFREGRDAMKNGDHAAACPKFAESYRLDPSPGTLLNLALCEEQAGKIAGAWTKLRQLVDTLPPQDDRHVVARDKIASLEPFLPRLRITVARAPLGSVVRLDGVELREASLDANLPVDPGTHVVTITTSSGYTQLRTIVVKPSERVTLELSVTEPPRVEAAATKAPSPPVLPLPPPPVLARSGNGSTPEAGAFRRAGFIAGGIGAVGLLTAGAFFGLGLRERSSADVHCEHLRCDTEGLDAANNADRFLRMADIALTAGVVGATVSGLMLWQAYRLDGRVTANSGGVSLNASLELP